MLATAAFNAALSSDGRCSMRREETSRMEPAVYPRIPPSSPAVDGRTGNIPCARCCTCDDDIDVTNGCSSKSVTSGRSDGSRLKQRARKSWPAEESVAGISGSSSAHAIWYIAVTGFEKCDHGGLPVAISMTVHPTLQMSAFFQPRALCCSLMTSGAIQSGVPLRPVLAVTLLCPSCFDAPKSASLMVPSFATSTFAPLMSRWAMPWRCRYSRPSSSCRVYTRTTASSNLPNRLTSERMLPPGTYSRKMESVSSVCSVPRYRTMFSWSKRSIMDTSCSSASSSLADTSDVSSCFTAISSPESRLRPRYTVPYAPAPSTSPRCQRILRDAAGVLGVDAMRPRPGVLGVRRPLCGRRSPALGTRRSGRRPSAPVPAPPRARGGAPATPPPSPVTSVAAAPSLIAPAASAGAPGDAGGTTAPIMGVAGGTENDDAVDDATAALATTGAAILNGVPSDATPRAPEGASLLSALPSVSSPPPADAAAASSLTAVGRPIGSRRPGRSAGRPATAATATLSPLVPRGASGTVGSSSKGFNTTTAAVGVGEASTRDTSTGVDGGGGAGASDTWTATYRRPTSFVNSSLRSF
mmetsp:Transcript_7174/g.25598  ORF Transcript_7174/g.25598 Transcript_7174/m.25598 type:complete len:583 (-) Transcript_7174:1354-3102(-)